MATFNISDIKGEQEIIIQEGTSENDTFIVGTNNGKYDPIINGLHSDGWGTDPATVGGEDKFILNNLTSKTVFIPNFDPKKDKIFLPKEVKRDQVWIEHYAPYIKNNKKTSEAWISYRPDLSATRKSEQLLRDYSKF